MLEKQTQTEKAPVLEVHDLTVSYQHRPVLWGIDFSIPDKSVMSIVGPNGAGKSTLLKAIMGLLPLSSGYVRFFGEELEKKRSIIAYVPQREEIDWDFPISVSDVVLMGRYGKLPFYKRPRKRDIEAAEKALHEVEMQDFRDRQISELSGGQQQRVFLARALAQEAQIYLMDEPFAGVDAATEKAIVRVFQRLREEGRTVICVHHDLNTVIEYFDWTLLLNMRLVACGPTHEVFSAENLNKTYGGRLGLLTEITEKLRKREWKKREDV